MRMFLTKIAVALLIVLACHAFAGRYADGTTDEYYLRFTDRQQSALVLGTSRAAQGIVPSEMTPVLKRVGVDHVPFNFSFTVAHSPYGPSYLRAIERKLDDVTRDGLFLLTVDPWSLSRQGGEEFQEDERMLGEQCMFNGTPNYEYLARHLPSGWGSLIGGPLHDPDTTSLLHEDGWLEVRIDNSKQMREKRTKAKVKHYREEMMPGRTPSFERMNYLKKTIELLIRHGSVILLRLPIGPELLELEQQLWLGFDDDIQRASEEMKVPYWDLSQPSKEHVFTDGNHLTANSAKRFSRQLAERIVQEREER